MAIQWAVTAQRAKVSPTELDDLLKGNVHANVANRFGLSVTAVEDFIGGRAHADVATWLGLPNMASAEELARELGREGAIGFLVARLFA